MHTQSRVFCFGLVVAGVFLAALVTAAQGTEVRTGTIVAPVSDSLRSARDLGRLSPGVSIQAIFALPLRSRAQLDSLIQLQHDRRSPLHHRWLTPRQFAGAFSADPEAAAAIVRTCRANGLQIDGINGPGTVIAVSGTVRDVERLFQTRIDRVDLFGEVHYANVRPAIRPASLERVGFNVLGLDDLPQAVTLGRAASLAPPAYARGWRDFGSGFDGSYTPAELAGFYEMPISTITNGSGSTIATIAVNAFRQGDFNAFYTKWLKAWYATLGEPATGLRPKVVVVAGHPHFVSQCNQNPACSLGITEDVEQSQSYQPGATDIVYEMGDLSKSSIVKAFNAVVTANVADDVNATFGGCENPSFDPSVDALIAQGSAQGQSFFAPSGVNGARCFDGRGLAFGVVFPASDPNVIGVGGTTVTTDSHSQYVDETAWDRSGGGVSTEWPIPGYQQGIPGEASTTFRNVPDVTLNADPVSGDDVFFNGRDSIEGGTSLSSAAAMAEFNAIVAGGYGRQGGYNQEFYSIMAGGGQGSTFDITTGSNGFYLAGPGYDNVTGWGSVEGTNLFLAWF